MILITTAGKVGTETARLLAQHDQPVRVLVRSPRRADDLTRQGIEVAVGDLGDPATLDEAMRGVASVVLVSPAVPEHELNVITSAVRAHVGHVVKVTSTASSDSPIARQRGQAEIEAGLRASGLPFTLLRSNFYMQNFLMQASEIAASDRFSASAGKGRVGLVDSRDVAAVAAEIAAAPAEHPNETYRLTGPELLTYADVAEVLSDGLGRRITFGERTREEDTQAMVDVGVPREIAEMNAHAVSLIADGDAAWLAEDLAEVLGRRPRSFAQFVDDHADVFTPQLADDHADALTQGARS